jgi:hypothetical protein
MDWLLKAISYSKYGWKKKGGLKVVWLLLGMQSGYITFCCFRCDRDSRARDKHYKIKDWSMTENSVPGEMGVTNLPLFDKERFYYHHHTVNWG